MKRRILQAAVLWGAVLGGLASSGWIAAAAAAPIGSPAWEGTQWSLAGTYGVGAPLAWDNLIRDGRPGGRGVTVAVLDTGVAYRNWQRFRRSPDFAHTRFVDPCDLVAGRIVDGRCTDRYPLDREGHGTWIADAIAGDLSNRLGITGLAYHATIMPVRVLNASGWGYPDTIAEGIRYAVAHHAQVINLSLEFYLGVTGRQVPTLVSAIRYARARGVLVVAAAGNDDAYQIAWPAADPNVLSVGATTFDGCVADYSNTSPDLDLVAPGGGNDAQLPDDPRCHPEQTQPDVFQMTFNNPARPGRFSIPNGWYGTSMACPLVSATAALVIASRVLGPHPRPAAIIRRLEQTATHLGSRVPNPDYGWGLINAAAATA